MRIGTRGGLLLVLAVVWLSPQRSASQTVSIVEDPAAIVQLILQLAEQVKIYGEALQQTYNQLKQIQNEITMIEQGAKNLASLNLNNAGALLGLYQQLDAKLAQARVLSFQYQQAVSQAQRLYPQIRGVQDPAQQQQLERQWATVQREQGQVAIATQAISAQQAQYQQKWADVLNRAAAAEGNLQIQQAGVQAQGLVGSQLLSVEQQLATQGRLEAVKSLEAASMKEATAASLDQAGATITSTEPPQGRILSLSK